MPRQVLIALAGLFFISLNSPAIAEEQVEEENSLMSADFQNEPTHIKSESLTLKSKARLFTYTGNVVVTQGELRITSDKLDGTYDEQNEIVSLTAEGSVIITKGEGIRSTGKKAHYVKATETMTLTGNPEVLQNNSILSADKIVIFLKEDRSTAEGNVRVKLASEATAEKGEKGKKPQSLLNQAFQ